MLTRVGGLAKEQEVERRVERMKLGDGVRSEGGKEKEE